MSMGATTRSRGLRGASLAVLLFALALVATSCAQAVYRLWLPTDGWDMVEGATAEELKAGVLIFTDNVLGAPSPLQPGDALLGAAGVPAARLSALRLGTFPGSRQSGPTMRYTVLRDGGTLDLDVPLKRWTAGSVARYNAGTFGAAGNWLGAVAMFGIGLFVLVRRPEEPAARALVLLGAVFLATTISGVVPDGPTTRLSGIWPLTAFFSYWIFGILFGPTLFVLALTFPRPKRVLQRFPWLVVLPYLVFWVLVAIFGPRPEVGWGLTGAFLVLALLSILHSTFTLRDAVSRAQLLWGLGGFIAAIALFAPLVLVATGVMVGATSRS